MSFENFYMRASLRAGKNMFLLKHCQQKLWKHIEYEI